MALGKGRIFNKYDIYLFLSLPAKTFIPSVFTPLFSQIISSATSSTLSVMLCLFLSLS